MKHSSEYKDLADQVGNLKYDALVEFLGCLSNKLAQDAQADLARGRPLLSKALFNAAINVYRTQKDIADAWKISEPFMKENQ